MQADLFADVEHTTSRFWRCPGCGLHLIVVLRPIQRTVTVRYRGMDVKRCPSCKQIKLAQLYIEAHGNDE